ncbi:unnamed protein product [Spirodela intermedia]|uniref:Importin N-terminal domain-containing protein n=1 Tax=Spirodela intermedia TaxID=51605 RepID=A0A7I8IQM1_SPIIN|nr:unnamed protein product [Spirodela intermedia]CAA6659826.1 unnamed protein product [Spirodela intermedia]
MDPPSLALVLQAALSQNPEERKAAEESLNQFQYTPQHLVRLLQIVVNGNLDLAVRQVASINFKNFVAKNWSPNEPGESPKISTSDKDIVRENILTFITQVPPLLRVQLGECLKNHNSSRLSRAVAGLLHWIKCNLQMQDEQIYGALFCLVHVVHPPVEVADLIKLICKIFWSSIYKIMGMVKVKKWAVHILNRLFTRFGDTKIQKPECKAFAQMFQKNYAGKILECHLHLLNIICTGGYLPDRVINLILQYLSSRSSFKEQYVSIIAATLDILLFDIIFPLMCFNDNDQTLWDEDPHEYVRKGYDIIEDLYSPRTAAMDFVSELVRKRGKGNLQKFIQFIVEIFRRYDEAAPDFKPYRQKDGALLAIGALCDKLKQTDPYKSELERMLVQHVFPEFNSHLGHLRAKAAWVAGQYAHINFSDKNNFRRALHSVVAGLRDPELPVRVDSVFALRTFVEACKDLNEIRPILPQLLDEFFKLMNEVENEDLVFTLETIVDKFGEEMAPYAIGLCQNLAAAFWRCIDSSEADDEGDDPGALAAVGCLRAISTILESVSRLPHLFVQIEPTLLPIMKRMLTTDGQDVFEEVLEIVSYMTFFSPTISLEMWSLWPLIMEALGDWAIDFFEILIVFFVCCRYSCSIRQLHIRGTSHFLTCKQPDYQQSLWNTLSLIMSDRNIEDGDIESAPKLIEVVFQNCKGQVDQWVEPYLRLTIDRLKRAEKPYLKCLLIKVIADALYYNPSLTLGTLQKLGVATDVFNLWFQMLQQVKKSGKHVNFKREHDKKICCLGLTSLMALPADQLPGEAMARICKAALELLVLYKNQVAESQKKDDGNDDEMDGFQTDEEDDDEDDSDKEMGDDTEEGDEADSTKLQKLAAQARAFQPDESDEDSDDEYTDDDEEEVESPIDSVDPFIFFVETVQVVQVSDPARFQTLMQSLDFHYQALASGIAQHAEQRKAEIEKEKLDKASAAS